MFNVFGLACFVTTRLPLALIKMFCMSLRVVLGMPIKPLWCLGGEEQPKQFLGRLRSLGLFASRFLFLLLIYSC